MPLKPEEVKAAIASGKNQKLADGRSLYLYVKNGRGYWTHQFQMDGVTRSKCLGPVHALTLAQARRARDSFAVARREGRLPAAALARKGEAFSTAAAAYLNNHADEWTPRTRADNKALVERYVPADFKAMSVTTITVEQVADVLRPIWDGPGNNRGSRLRRLIAGILAAKGVHLNPAQWEEGQLRELLSRKRAVVKHHEAMPWQDVPAFVAKLGDSVEDRAGKFAILTSVRRKEALGALWGEFDLVNRIWTIPGERMKKPGGKVPPPHSVPLTDAMIACLGEPGAADAFVFGSTRTGRMLGNKACDKEWHDLAPFTLHGFRTSMSTWAEEKGFQPNVIEAALAHAKGNATTQSYLRSGLFDLRRKLMQAWSSYVSGDATFRA